MRNMKGKKIKCEKIPTPHCSPLSTSPNPYPYPDQDLSSKKAGQSLYHYSSHSVLMGIVINRLCLLFVCSHISTGLDLIWGRGWRSDSAVWLPELSLNPVTSSTVRHPPFLMWLPWCTELYLTGTHQWATENCQIACYFVALVVTSKNSSTSSWNNDCWWSVIIGSRQGNWLELFSLYKTIIV